MRLKCLTCEALARPVYLHAALSPHFVDVELVRLGLHNTPNTLRARLQEMIDATDPGKFDGVLLAYGLCGQATAGLKATRVPLVIPRAHDCITLFLGSRARYQKEFTDHPGTYWYSQDFIERKDGSITSLSMGATESTIQATYELYVQKYGQDNADYLMEVMGAWQKHYNRAVFIDLGVSDAAAVEEQARGEAERRGWAYERMQGDIRLIQRLLWGSWQDGNDDDFLVVPVGQQVVMTASEDILRAQAGD